MGSDAHDEHLFLPFAAALYGSDSGDGDGDEAHAFEPLVLDDDDALAATGSSDEHDSSELVPLLELVSAEDVERVYAQVLDSDDDARYHDLQYASAFDLSLAALPLQQQQQPFVAVDMQDGGRSDITRATTTTAATMLAAPTARYLSKKELSGTKAVKHKANKARDERRSELIYLRKKVAELEAQLGSIHTKRPRLSAGDDVYNNRSDGRNNTLALPAHTRVHSGSPSEPALRPRFIAHAWEDICSRQSDERVKAERENIRLRLVLENQLKIAKSLERILNKKSTAKDIEEFVERSHVSAPDADATDADVFATLLREVEQLYGEIDAVFEANGLANTETPLTNARIHTNAASGMILEMCATKVLPFDVHATGTAVWHHFAYAKARTPFRCYTYSSSKYLHAPEDTVTEDFVLKLDAKGTYANFRVKQVLQRHVEHARVVVLWRADFEAFEFSSEPVSGMRFSESGFIVIKPPRAAPNSHSLVQTCYVMTPDFADGTNHPRVGAITDFVLASTATNISSTHQMIENVLLEQAVNARQGSSSGSSAMFELLQHA